jgi:hypothetical protein
MKLDKRIRILLLCGFCTAGLLIILLWDKERILQHVSLLILSTVLGILFANLTEGFLGEVAVRLMNFVAGFGMKQQDAEFDESGVPRISLRRLGKKYYNAVRVAVAAFDYYDNWKKTGNEQYMARFRNCVDSLIDNMKLITQENLNYGVWEYDYPWSYGLEPPWISGLAQGMGVQALSRAYKLTGEEKYFKAAKVALNAFLVEVKAGGVTIKDNENEWWYEEHAGKGVQESRALNGMMYALLGIYEYYEHTGDEEAKRLFAKGVKCLKNNLARFDADWWSYYDILGTIATKSYHKVHIDLLRQIYEITREEEFFKICKKWSNYKANFFIREFVRQKPNYHDMVILALNITGIFVLLEGAAFFIY